MSCSTALPNATQKIRSEPPSAILPSESDTQPTTSQWRRVMDSGSEALQSAAVAAVEAAAEDARSWVRPYSSGPVQESAAVDPKDLQASRPQPFVVRLFEALGEPELGTELLPTVGSKGHQSKTCKPCAFVYTSGCNNGKQCAFCHLCPPDEKKRRRREKKPDVSQHRVML